MNKAVRALTLFAAALVLGTYVRERNKEPPESKVPKVIPET